MKKNKITYADKAKEIISKYKARLGEDLDKFDSLSQESLAMELEKLKADQEAVRASMESSEEEGLKKGGWVNPKHKGYCTPMSKSTCTPRRKAFARRAKAGEFHEEGGYIPHLAEGGLTTNDYALIAESVPALINIGRGIFEEPDTLNLPDRTISRRVQAPTIDNSEAIRGTDISSKTLRTAFPNSMAAAIAAESNATSQRSKIIEDTNNMNARLALETDLSNIGIDEFNAQMLYNKDIAESTYNKQAEAAKEAMITTGVSQLGQAASNYAGREFEKNALETSKQLQEDYLAQNQAQFEDYMVSTAVDRDRFLKAQYGIPETNSPQFNFDNTDKTNTATGNKSTPAPKTVTPVNYDPGEIPVMISDTASRYGINPELLNKQLVQESGLNMNAQSDMGASGIAQFTDSTLAAVLDQYNKEIGQYVNNGVNKTVEDYKSDPALQIELGAYHMRKLTDKYKGDHGLALVAYNGGDGAVYWSSKGKAGVPPDMYADPNNPTIEEWVKWAEDHPNNKPHSWANETLDYVKKIYGDQLKPKMEALKQHDLQFNSTQYGAILALEQERTRLESLEPVLYSQEWRDIQDQLENINKSLEQLNSTKPTFRK